MRADSNALVGPLSVLLSAATPTRSLTDQRRPHKYTRSESTDIRKTWARAARRERLLAFFRRER